jgi:hypothetical protein
MLSFLPAVLLIAAEGDDTTQRIMILETEICLRGTVLYYFEKEQDSC